MIRNISTRCRRESTARNRTRKTLSELCKIEDLSALVTSGYLTAGDSAVLVQEALREVEGVRASIDKDRFDNGTLARLNDVEGKLNDFSGGAEVGAVRRHAYLGS